MDGTNTLQMREGKAFILVPQKLAVGNWAVKTGTSGFGNRNIRNLKYSRWNSSAKTGPSGLPNRTVRFFLFRAGASGSCPIHVATYFDDSAGESTTSSTSSMKGGNSSHNGSDLDKGNILKPIFDTLTEEGHKVFVAYRVNLEELFLLRGEVTW